MLGRDKIMSTDDTSQVINHLLKAVKHLIDHIFEGTKIMGTLDDIESGIDAIRTAQETLKLKVNDVGVKIAAIDLRLDDVRALVASLKGQQMDQVKVDAILAKLAAVSAASTELSAAQDAVSTATDAVVGEVDSIE